MDDRDRRNRKFPCLLSELSIRFPTSQNSKNHNESNNQYDEKENDRARRDSARGWRCKATSASFYHPQF